MDNNGRPNHMEDFLCVLHKGGWYEWIDYKNKIYSNLKLTEKMWNSSYTGDVYADGLIDNPYSLPTEQECTDGLTQLQTDFDNAKIKKETDKTNANQKLKDLGLTDDEIKAIKGIS